MPELLDRRNIKRMTKAVLRRNLRLLQAVEYIKETGSACALDLSTSLYYSASAGRNILRILKDTGLVEYEGSHKTGNSRLGSGFYRLSAGAEERSKEIFVVDEVPNAKTCATSRPKVLPPGIHIMGDDQQWNPRRYKVLVHRDPLVAAICGHGRAPSLNFMDSNGGPPCP